jgi:hypothetical protein
MMLIQYIKFFYLVKERFQYIFLISLQQPNPEDGSGKVPLNLKILKFARSFVDDAVRGEE